MYGGYDSQLSLLALFEVLSKQLVASSFIPANVNSVRDLRYDFCGEGHFDDYYTRYVEEVPYTQNYQDPDPYLNTYSPWWDDHSSIN